ncbi:hypothetical protein K1719_016157 [Acacia pycnantha]|nr:hypothetical protein K1719_016157 [Acacia pycnantha]
MNPQKPIQILSQPLLSLLTPRLSTRMRGPQRGRNERRRIKSSRRRRVKAAPTKHPEAEINIHTFMFELVGGKLQTTIA